MRRLILAALVAFAAGCSPPAPAVAPTFHAQEDPQLLSDWGMVQVEDGRLVTGEGVSAYTLNTALFTDYAQKFRTVWMPEGQSASIAADGSFVFPIGAVITKTFYFPVAEDGVSVLPEAEADADAHGFSVSDLRLIETRVLVLREGGWRALSYIWNEAQTEATLKRSGARLDLTLVRADGREAAFRYIAPNVTQCAACHALRGGTALHPIGLAPRHVDRPGLGGFEGPEGQIDRLVEAGFLQTGGGGFGPATADAFDPRAPLEARARAYLEINCAHCHNPDGPADTSGLYLDAQTPTGPAFGLCKPPVAAGAGSGDLRFDIAPGAPEQSILLYRVLSTDPAAMMPEIGRSLAHDEGAALLRSWIESLEGGCG